jgi:hypothetical protein
VRNYRKVVWEKLEEHRIKAANHPLQILILGPSDDGSSEFKTRCKLRNKLTEWGHKAAFGEELHNQPQALSNPVDDLILQAASAHLIIMIYCSRGTQTERDMLLSNRHFAAKSIVFVEHLLFDKIQTSLTGRDWDLMDQVAEVVKYSRRRLSKCAVETVFERTEELRRQVYARAIKYGRVFE